jgi:hypothetical protein
MEKEELYKKVYIRSEADLPKEDGFYYFHKPSGEIYSHEFKTNSPAYKRLILNISKFDWYFAPFEDKQPGQSKIFLSKEDAINWVSKHIPFAVKPKRSAKAHLINPFTSYHCFNEVIKHLGEELYNKFNNNESVKDINQQVAPAECKAVYNSNECFQCGKWNSESCNTLKVIQGHLDGC